ncbi:bifunctional glutamate N-acetyltransferase/amino-acid acetyltransferase ArgJ [Actinospongicola halichondriae]|uniref:bifunctional glutamate N-acetyltransferase/amino-acid acetyltransferase ArgJ n=1 Tax=Actinospongicola halichondriae TaxID=3236844 RepID=UPI003D41F92F
MIALPRGFRAHVANIGIKDDTDDFAVIAADVPCAASAVFTKSRFAGPSVTISREHVADGSLRAIAVVSKNANVATGAAGHADAVELAEGVAKAVGCLPSEVLIASTGVIGRRYPMDRVRDHLSSMPAPDGTDAGAVATAIMTTDTHPKSATAAVGDISIVGIAKGVGMIEPDMATMLAFVLTDAAVPQAELDQRFRAVVDRTFNCVSVDTDTSTSDTAALLASGEAGAVDGDEFEAALEAVCLDLTRQLASDGEGAETLIVVTVDGARDDAQAKRVAKTIVNSPLVKTAVHGADPNWGRIAMAIGKCSDDTDIDQERVVIRIGDQELYPAPADDAALAELEQYLAGDEVLIHVSLEIDAGAATVYGCDLTDGYVRINADYTT